MIYFSYMKGNRIVIMNTLIVIGGKLWASWLWIWLLGSWYYNLCITFWFITIPRRFRRGNVFKYPKCTIWLRLWGNKNSIIYQDKLIENSINKVAEYLKLLSPMFFRSLRKYPKKPKTLLSPYFWSKKEKGYLPKNV